MTPKEKKLVIGWLEKAKLVPFANIGRQVYITQVKDLYRRLDQLIREVRRMK